LNILASVINGNELIQNNKLNNTSIDFKKNIINLERPNDQLKPDSTVKYLEKCKKKTNPNIPISYLSFNDKKLKKGLKELKKIKNQDD